MSETALVTGSAGFIGFHTAERLLQAGHKVIGLDAEETDAVYVRRCIPRKARLDLIYQKNQSLRLDLWLIWVTAARIFGLPGARQKAGKTG